MATDVAFEASSKNEKTPRVVPLAEAVRAVVHHQTTAGSYPQNGDIISKNEAKVNGGGHVLFVSRMHPM